MKSLGELAFALGRGWVALGTLFFVTAVVGVVASADPPTAEEAGYRLAAHSLVRDGDLVLSIEDEGRMRLQGWPESIRPPMVLSEDKVLHFAEPFFYSLFLAPFITIAPRLGPIALNLLLFAVAAVAAATSLRRRTGDSAAWTITVAIFGSVLFTYALTALPVALMTAAVAVAFNLLSLDSPGKGRRLHDLYPGEPGPVRFVVRSLVAGVLLGVVAAHHPLFVLLLIAPFSLLPQKRWGTGMPSVLVGAAMVLALTWLVSSLWTDLGVLPGSGQRVEVSVGSGLTGIERAELSERRLDEWKLSLEAPKLLVWNALYAAVGRHVGLVPYFLPLLLLIVFWRQDEGGQLLLFLAAIGLLLPVVALPFDFAGLPAALGNRLFIPFYVALWWLPGRTPERAGGLIWLALGTIILWPLWIGGNPLYGLENGELPRGPILERLPYETTQRDLPVRGELVTRDLLVRPLAGTVPGGRKGHFRLSKRSGGEILVASAAPIATLELGFDGGESTALEVGGGDVEDMILRPDGGVSFVVRLRQGRVRHPVWWSDEEHSFYRLRVAMPEAKGETTFSIGSAAR